jgi:replicative DNA helicase
MGEIAKYALIPEDFNDKFTRSIFSAIHNLFQTGATTITPVDIDNYLSNYDLLFKEFEKNGGINYLQDCEDLSQTENFDYYYNRVKKLSALRRLKESGFNISKVYPDNIISDFNKEQKVMEAFDSMSISDIFDKLLEDFTKIQYEYVGKTGGNSIFAVDGILELKEELKVTPEIGPPLQGDIFNTVVRGARRGKFYLRSGSTGAGKSRTMIGDACFLAYPERYSLVSGQWESAGSCETVAIITTELRYDEVQTIILAYLSGVNEENILNGMYGPGEEERVDHAIEIMDKYKTHLIIESIPDPSIAQLVAVIRTHVIVNHVSAVFYDYIFSSPNLLNEFRDLKIREDVALMMLSTALKDLATDLNIFIMSGTQLSGDFENHKGIRNQTLVRGSKAIADKIDVGCITMPVTIEEANLLQSTLTKLHLPMPTQVTDIYKGRRIRYKNVRIWSITDLGTGRITDLFMTDPNYNVINVNIVQVKGYASMEPFPEPEPEPETVGELIDAIEQIDPLEDIKKELTQQINQKASGDMWDSLIN